MIRLQTEYLDPFDDRITLVNTAHSEGVVLDALVAIVARVGIFHLRTVRVFDNGNLVNILSQTEVVRLIGLELPKELTGRLRS